VDRMIQIGLAAAVVLYIVVGLVFAVVHPRLTPEEEIIAVNTNHRCGAKSVIGDILFWPIYVDQYFTGVFDTCRRTLAAP